MRKRNNRAARSGIESLERRLCLSTVTNVTTHHGDAYNDGANLAEAVLTPANVNATNFGRQFTTQLDGGVVTAQPVYLQNVNVTTGTSQGIHSVVYVGTEVDGLFAIDSSNGTVLWHDSFLNTTDPTNLTATVGVGPIRQTDVAGNTDVGNNIGIVATPAFDTSNGDMFVTTNTREVRGTDTHFVQRLWTINFANGAAVRSTVIADTIANGVLNGVGGNSAILGDYTYVSGPIINGTGNNNPANPAAPTYPNTDRWLSAPGGQSGSVIAFNAILQMERPAVTLVNGTLYLAFASHGDDGPYYGWVLGYRESDLSLTAVFNAIPTFSTNVDSSQPYIAEAGIWMSGSNIATDGTYLYITTGNGAFNGAAANFDSNGFPIDHDYGDALIKLAVDPSSTATNQNGNGWGLKVADYFVPSNQYQLNALDLDLGSGGVTLLPNNVLDSAGNPMLVIGGKESRIYLIDRNNLGKFNSSYPQGGNTDPRPYDHVLGEYSYAGINIGGHQVYSSATFLNGNFYMGLNATPGLEFSVSNLLAGATSPIAATATSLGYPGATWQATANGSTNGLIWALNRTGSILVAYNASSFVNPIYSSGNNANDTVTGGVVKFSLPLIVNGMAYVGTQTGQLIGYGLNAGYLTGAAFSAPTGLSTTMINTADARLTWTSNSSAATEFRIDRSTDGVNFTTVGYTANPGTSTVTFDDTTIAPTTKYFYRVAAVSGTQTPVVSTTATYTPVYALPASATVYLRVDGDSAHLDVFANSTGQGMPIASVLISQIAGLTVDPSTTTLSIDYSNGNPLFGSSLAFNPTSAATLSMIASSAASLNVFADHLTLATGSGSSTISFSSNVTSLNYTGGNAGSAITQTAQPAGGSFQVTAFHQADNITISAGTFTFNDPGYGTSLPIWQFNSLTIGTGTVIVNPSADPTNRGLLVVNTLSMTGGATPMGRLDLGRNSLIVTSPTFNPALVVDGSDLGRWDGTGIISSAAASDTTHLTTLGVLQTATAATFDGYPAPAGAWVVNHTFYGDANLDFKVDGSDYSLIDAGYTADATNPGSVTGWSAGDFNYDGAIDGSDYTLIDNAFNNQVIPFHTQLSLRPLEALPLQAHSSFHVSISLRDQFGNAVIAPGGGLTVALATTSTTGHFNLTGNPSPITTVTIPPGSSSVGVVYFDTNPGTTTLTATAAGVGSGSILNVLLPAAGTPVSMGLNSSTTTPTVGSPVTLSVGLRDFQGNLAVNSTTATTVSLLSSSATGYFSTSSTGSPVVTSVSIPVASGPVPFYYFDTVPGTPTITTTAVGYGTATYQPLIAGPVAKVAFTSAARSPNVNVASAPVTVSLTDAAGNLTASASAVTVNLTSTSGGGTFLNSSFGTTTSVVIPAGSTGATIEYKDTTAGTPTITASATGLTSATQQQTVSAAYALPSGTVAFYSFENPANLYADSSGNNNTLKAGTGTVVFDAGAAAGHNGSALFSNGGSLQTSSGAFPTGVPTGATAYTIAAWIDINSIQKNGIVGWGNYGTNNQVNAFRTTQGDAAPDGQGLDNYWWGNDDVVTTPNYLLNNWAYVAVTSNGTGTRTMYVNGIAIGTFSGTGQATTAANFHVGVTNVNEFFSGRMSDLLIANVAFSSTQISTLYGQA